MAMLASESRGDGPGVAAGVIRVVDCQALRQGSGNSSEERWHCRAVREGCHGANRLWKRRGGAMTGIA